MRRRLIAVLISLFLVFGFASGFAVRVLTEPVPPVPVLKVTTQEVNVTTQQVQPTDKFSCKVSAVLRDPGATYDFSETIVCKALPNAGVGHN